MKSAAILFALSVLLPAASRAQDAAFIRSHYTKREVRIAMRDGVRLFTSIYLPRDTTERHPIVLKRPTASRPTATA